MNKKTVKDIEVKGKRVLMRADFNVPLNKELKIDDDTRIKAALPTIKYLLDNGAKLILMSHLGRPKGKVQDDMRLTPVAERLSELLGKEVKKLDDCIGNDVKKAVSEMEDGDVVLLENLRFYNEETKNDPEFAKKLASLGDVYVNDAFGTAHRAHASTEGVTKFLKTAVAGFLLGKEIEYFDIEGGGTKCKNCSSSSSLFFSPLKGAIEDLKKGRLTSWEKLKAKERKEILELTFKYGIYHLGDWLNRLREILPFEIIP